MKTQMRLILVSAALCFAAQASAEVDGNAVLGGVIGGGAGAAIGSHVGGRNGAILGGAIGGGAGAAIGSNQTRHRAPAPRIYERQRFEDDGEHHDNGRHRGHHKHHHDGDHDNNHDE